MKLTYEQIETIWETANSEDQIELSETRDDQIKCSITDEDNITETIIIERDGTIL